MDVHLAAEGFNVKRLVEKGHFSEVYRSGSTQLERLEYFNMDGVDLQTWNKRYLAGEFGYREPDAFVMEAHTNYLQPLLPCSSTGLDLAGGAGHHAVWLAQQRWRMTLLDGSEAALTIAQEKAAALPEDTKLETVQGAALDMITRFTEQQRRFGFVLVSFFLDRALLPLLPKIVEPNGLLLYRTYTVDNERLGNPRGPRNPEYLLQSQELLDVYRGMKILHYNETVAHKGVVEFIAQQGIS